MARKPGAVRFAQTPAAPYPDNGAERSPTIWARPAAPLPAPIPESADLTRRPLLPAAPLMGLAARLAGHPPPSSPPARQAPLPAPPVPREARFPAPPPPPIPPPPPPPAPWP